ncbi:hypothetical protein [Streptomyces sp. ADI93-02]|uniref:hypothetical protein n=1 Tax=Streptomyces sp. ADI93-02 TaxID=1522757 RepID=UPI001F1512D9|nr:hypothetical protein [Streptomyces sp. ADI93-02]
MQPTDGGTASANPSWVAADMGAMIHQCDAELAEHDTRLDRLTSGVAALEAEMETVHSKRRQVVATREQALRVQETLLAAAQAGAALRSGQHGGRGKFKVVPDPDEREGADSSSDGAADPTETTINPLAGGAGHTAEASAASDASKLGPRGTRALQIINSEPDQRWTGKLLAVRLEGQEAEVDGKAHNRARTLMDDLAKKQLVLKKYSDDGRRCYFVTAAAAEAA